jgi:hypothetical protein
MNKTFKTIIAITIIFTSLKVLDILLRMNYIPYRNYVQAATWKNRTKQHTMMTLDKIYPEQGIKHYLAMYSIHYTAADKDNYEAFNNLYISIEGIDEFKSLKEEVMLMNNNNHWTEFFQIAIENDIKNMDMSRVKEMMDVILKHKY